MSKRNFILLIIVLLILAGFALVFLYFKKPTTPNGTEDTGDSNFISSFNPFGGSKDVDPKENTDGEPGDYIEEEEVPVDQNVRLLKVSSMPVAGFGIFPKERYVVVPEVTPIPVEEDASAPKTTTPKATPTAPLTEFVPAVRYVAKTDGNIYQTFADALEERKFSGTVIPRIYDALFGNNSQSVVMRYLKTDDKTIETFVGILPKEVLGGDTSDENEVTGIFLPQNITDLSMSSDGMKIFYLFNSGGNAIGITADFAGGKKVQVFDSPFTEWLSNWSGNNTVALTTKPSTQVLGYVYGVDVSKKTAVKIFGDVNGLTTLPSPNGKMILYGNSNLDLYLYNTETRSSDKLPISGLPEKCVWAKTNDKVYCASPNARPVGNFPDSWYKGEASFSDSFWVIDIVTSNTNLILDPLDIPTGEEVDGIKLALDNDANYLFFVNKKDSFLWEIKLK